MIALIPARGGSKGLPGKNIKPLQGKPLIAHTIEAALKSDSIERVIVTTDSEEIASIAKEYGAEVPFLRPEYLADDTSSAIDVYLHAVEYLKTEEHEMIDQFMVLLPTAPLRTSQNIDEAIELLKKQKAETLISMTEAETPISWYYEKTENGFVKNAGFDSGNSVKNRQANKNYYIPNGAIYILDYEMLKNDRTYYGAQTIAYIMNREESIDIDTQFDFDLVEYIMSKRCK